MWEFLSTYSYTLRTGFLVRKCLYFTLDSFQVNEAHRVESHTDSIRFKIMFDKWISRHDTCIAVQKGLNAKIDPTS